MTISLIVIIMEVIGNITFGLFIMIVFIVVKWVGDIFNEVDIKGWLYKIVISGKCEYNYVYCLVLQIGLYNNCFNFIIIIYVLDFFK